MASGVASARKSSTPASSAILRGGEAVVAGDHHRADAHRAQLVEALAHALLDRRRAARSRRAPASRARRRAASRPARAMPVERRLQLRRRLAALVGDPAQDRVAGALAQPRAVEVDAAHARLRGERHERRRRAARARARAGRTAWPARRSSVPPASRRPARTAAPPRRGRASETPGIGTNAAAWRLPSVIVPVLSSSSTSTSPDASTARPESASTLRRTSRSMPAMPIADSSAPIVVGMSATSSAISVGDRHVGCPRSRRTAAASRRRRGRSSSGRRAGCRARSRSASCAARRPRRGAIMRSRNDWPGSCVISTTMRSESTRVPPVTARAVAAGLADDGRRLAGDRRLVDRRDALDDGAVAGDHLAGLDDHDVAAAQLGGGLASVPSRSRATVVGAHRAQRVGLRLAAALGDRLGEVAEDHRQPQPDGDGQGEPARGRRRRRVAAER